MSELITISSLLLWTIHGYGCQSRQDFDGVSLKKVVPRSKCWTCAEEETGFLRRDVGTQAELPGHRVPGFWRIVDG